MMMEGDDAPIYWAATLAVFVAFGAWAWFGARSWYPTEGS